MPKYKKSAKKVSERKMPFEEVDQTLLNISIHLLKNCEIEQYSKLHFKLAYDKIDKFAEKYGLEEVGVS